MTVRSLWMCYSRPSGAFALSESVLSADRYRLDLTPLSRAGRPYPDQVCQLSASRIP